MHKYIVTYDLNRPGQDYAAISAVLGAIASEIHRPQKSVWFVTVNLDAASFRDIVQKHALDGNDSIVIIEIAGDWAVAGLDNRSIAWLKKPKAA